MIECITVWTLPCWFLILYLWMTIYFQEDSIITNTTQHYWIKRVHFFNIFSAASVLRPNSHLDGVRIVFSKEKEDSCGLPIGDVLIQIILEILHCLTCIQQNFPKTIPFNCSHSTSTILIIIYPKYTKMKLDWSSWLHILFSSSDYTLQSIHIIISTLNNKLFTIFTEFFIKH